MKTGRALCSLLLSALLLSAQQAAFVHALGHGVAHAGAAGASAVTPGPVSAASPGGVDRNGDSGGSYCDKCFQFAHVSGATVAAAYPQFIASVSGEAASARPVAELAAEAPPARSRDPPVIL